MKDEREGIKNYFQVSGYGRLFTETGFIGREMYCGMRDHFRLDVFPFTKYSNQSLVLIGLLAERDMGTGS